MKYACVKLPHTQVEGQLVGLRVANGHQRNEASIERQRVDDPYAQVALRDVELLKWKTVVSNVGNLKRAEGLCE